MLNSGKNEWRLIVLGIVLVCVFGCNSTLSPQPINADASIHLGSANRTFRSWNGVWKGTDIDTDIAFSTDGSVLVRHYGDGLDEVSGTFKINGSTISINAKWDSLIGMPGSADFPDLILKQSGDDFFLFPVGTTLALNYGYGSAWPLKQIEDNSGD